MRVLITGSSGRLGFKLVKYCTRYFEVIPTHMNEKLYKDSIKLDICSKEALQPIFKIRPDVVIHTAAMTNVDACEVDKEAAWLVNVEGTKNLAEAVEKLGSKLVFVSTDYVFDGKKGMYRETDKPNPINYYGKTKLEAEKIVERTCKDFIIVRSSVLYGSHPSKLNFVSWLIQELKSGKNVNVVTDQFVSPTLTDNLAEMIIELVKREENGIFHAAGRERTSRFDLAMRVAEIFDLDKTLIKPITSDELSWKARRPKDSSLDVSKISKIIKPLNIEEGLEFLRDDLR